MLLLLQVAFRFAGSQRVVACWIAAIFHNPNRGEVQLLVGAMFLRLYFCIFRKGPLGRKRFLMRQNDEKGPVL